MPTGVYKHKPTQGFQDGHIDYRSVDGVKRMAIKLSDKYKGVPKPHLLAEKHPNWKGKDVGYVALHAWVKRRLHQPKTCTDCLRPKRLDLCNLNGKYDRNLNNWGYKCRSCHKKYDLAKLGKRSGYKTHCKNGHEYNDENTRRHKLSGYVYCNVCNRIRARARKMKLINELRG